MNTRINDISKMKLTTKFAWYVTLLVLILGYRYLKDTVVFILSKLYEFFIQQNPVKL